MPRDEYDRALAQLRANIGAMGDLVDEAIRLSMVALANQDGTLAKQIVADDARINQWEHDIEEECLVLIATQQPLAGDLRMIATVFTVVHELERIGDYAEGIAKTVIRMGKEPLLKPLIDAPRMAEMSRDMLRRSLRAFLSEDAEGASCIPQEDDVIDHLYNQIYDELVGYMIKDPNNVPRATRLLWVAHNLERIADRVTNICERVVFMVTGKVTDLNI